MSTPATINGKEVFDLLRDDLAAIEREFGRDTVAGVEAITEIGEYLRGGGGKRIRPALLLLSSKLFNYQGRGAIRLGAVVEIIHTATLVHDDIIDEAQIRRGRPAANTQWGNSKCVLAGDWLYMQAFKIAVQERNFRILDTLIDLTQQMVEGELLQMEKLGKLISLDEHFDLIYRKTACLFSVCMRVGGILGGATREQEESLAQYGHASERKQIETVLQERAFDGVTHAEILEILEKYGSLEAANTRALRFAELARNAICSFPDSEIKRALLWAPEFVVAREK